MESRDVLELMGRAPPLAEQIDSLHASLVGQGTLPSIAFASPSRALSYDTPQRVLVSHVHKKLFAHFVRVWTMMLQLRWEVPAASPAEVFL